MYYSLCNNMPEEVEKKQIEVAGLIASSKQEKLARKFLHFMMSDAFQSIIPTTNWMYPTGLDSSQLPAAFNQLIDPAPALLFDDSLIAANRKRWINEWLEAMSQ